MRTANEITLCTLLKAMNDKGVALSKIAIQKVAYFLITQGMTLGYRFKPFTYGPYSSDLSQALDDLEFWDHLSLNNNIYTVEKIPEIDSKKLPIIKQNIDCFFDKILKTKNPGFEDIEVYGTILYCQQALKTVGEQVNANSVLEEFKGWKGDKYSDQKIRSAYDHLTKVLQ